MIRKIVLIDEEKCTGCGACARACHEGAIGMINGKAKLLRDDYCDGLGDCLPACPAGAISFIQREAAAYDQAAVQAHRGESHAQTAEHPEVPGALENWPVQLKLAPVSAPCFQGADLLIAADCTAFSFGAFHQRFLRGRVLLIGCSKLDGVDYTQKLSAILRANDVRSVTVLRMEVPCCGGLELAVRKALEESGKNLPLSVTVVSTRGELL